MAELTLDGCRAEPLGSYLAGLGMLRAVTRLLDPEATARWERARLVLGSRFGTVEELVDELAARYEPEAIVSPWNAGSGFAGNGKNPTAERALQAVRDSDDPRLDGLREAVAAGDLVVSEGRSRGWGGKGDELWDKARKAEVLALCRSRFPDAALSWVDAAVALGQDAEPAYSRLLGTGGNFGRQDLSATYLARVTAVFGDRRGARWLRAALTGDESVSYLRDAVGQFDPGRAGGIQSSPLEKADDKGFVNPWAFLLTVEGALLFATAVVRRHGAEYSRAALPFQVRASTAGYATAAPGETPLGELWAPEWATPTRLAGVAHLLGEGRAEWRTGAARSGLDFARAVATLGVDRGLTAFTRHVFVDRLGQNPLAVPAGRIAVRRRGGVELLSGLDLWLDEIRRADPPSAVTTGQRGVEQALFRHARHGGASALADVFAAVGRCHEAIARSGAMRKVVRPLVLDRGADFLDELRPASDVEPELRLALALATAQDQEAESSLRFLLSPVQRDRRSKAFTWTGRPVTASLALGPAGALAEAARRRGFPGETKDDQEPPPAFRGARIAFHHGLRLRSGDLQTWFAEALDEHRVTDLLAGLLTVDWPAESSALPGDRPMPDPAVDILLPFLGSRPLDLDDGTKITLRPGYGWPVLLAAGRVSEVLDDAAARLRIAGLRHVVAPVPTGHDGIRLAAALLLTVPDHERLAALRRVAVVPDPPRHDQEITA